MDLMAEICRCVLNGGISKSLVGSRMEVSPIPTYFYHIVLDGTYLFSETSVHAIPAEYQLAGRRGQHTLLAPRRHNPDPKMTNRESMQVGSIVLR